MYNLRFSQWCFEELYLLGYNFQQITLLYIPKDRTLQGRDEYL
jgi:hypothetical protein